MAGALRLCASLLAFATLIGATVAASPDVSVQARKAFGIHARAIAVSEPFAVVNVDGWPFENGSYTGQALFRRFRFGWQMIDLAYGRFHVCELRGTGVLPSSVAALTRNATAVPDSKHETCPPARPFAPTSADEEAIRSVISDNTADNAREWFHDVDVADGYALIHRGASGGGGPLIARKRAGVWNVYYGTGGAPSACWLVQFGNVPAATAHRLMVEDMGGAPDPYHFTRTDHCPAYQ